MESASVPIVVPGGVWTTAGRVREFSLRPLTPFEEIAFLDGSALPRAKQVTALLARCAGLPEATVSSLTVGDREALLLHLRRLSYGDRVASVLSCPRGDCGEKLDLDFRVSDLLLAPYSDSRPTHELTFIASDGNEWFVRFRLPTGADQEEVAARFPDDSDRGARLMLERCVERAEINGSPSDDFPMEVTDRIAAAMESLDPQAEITFESACPACSQSFQSQFDASSLYFPEIEAHASALLREVHLLASIYHWSEEAILTLPPWRRRRYLDLVENAWPSGGRV